MMPDIMTPPLQSSTLEGLPKVFVNSLRTLFEVLDDKGTGFVKLSDIEVRWEDDGTKGLPKGVVDCLRKVTPPNGLLSFERFCAGLKICLLRNELGGGVSGRGEEGGRPPSAPMLEVEGWGGAPQQQRALSMPQLARPPLLGPPKPPRAAHLDKAEIRTALHHWQMGVLQEERRANYPLPASRPRPLGDNQSHVVMEDGKQQQQGGFQSQSQYRKANGTARRREPRRHTVHNGIDYNTLKWMKQIELEKEVLSQGLEAVDRAREWYVKQIAAVQEKLQYVCRMGYSEQWTDAQEERLGLQRARILEVNRHLSALTDARERGGLPLHMNLHLGPHPGHLITQLRHRNQYLTQEVSKKAERITALEREKASLIRELFHTRAQTRPPPTDPSAFL